MLETQIEAKQAAARVSEGEAECDRKHQPIAEEIEAVQKLRLSTGRHSQGQRIQAARMDAMGCRVEELKNLLMQCEIRMETQMQEMCSQTQTLCTMQRRKQSRVEDNIKDLLKDTDLLLSKPLAKNVTLKSKDRSGTSAGPSGTKLLPPKHQQNSFGHIRIQNVTKAIPPPPFPARRALPMIK